MRFWPSYHSQDKALFAIIQATLLLVTLLGKTAVWYCTKIVSALADAIKVQIRIDLRRYMALRTLFSYATQTTEKTEEADSICCLPLLFGGLISRHSEPYQSEMKGSRAA